MLVTLVFAAITWRGETTRDNIESETRNRDMAILQAQVAGCRRDNKTRREINDRTRPIVIAHEVIQTVLAGSIAAARGMGMEPRPDIIRGERRSRRTLEELTRLRIIDCEKQVRGDFIRAVNGGG